MTDTESAAWQSFISVSQNFLGKRKAENYQELVENILSKFKYLSVKMSIKVLFSHLNRFPTNLGDLSEEHGKRLHQDIKVMEKRYQGKWDAHMMADCCWSLQRYCLAASHLRKFYKRKFVNID